mmetsp:Transcript_108660/g.249102  ORF Transcript_108660/g.249102 Transcript_108660/m.249102 type:complete len:914 (-) Transcript_108660:27-2768(-)
MPGTSLQEYEPRDLFRVVGASIAYDFWDSRSAVNDCVTEWLDELDSASGGLASIATGSRKSPAQLLCDRLHAEHGAELAVNPGAFLAVAWSTSALQKKAFEALLWYWRQSSAQKGARSSSCQTVSSPSSMQVVDMLHSANAKLVVQLTCRADRDNLFHGLEGGVTTACEVVVGKKKIEAGCSVNVASVDGTYAFAALSLVEPRGERNHKLPIVFWITFRDPQRDRHKCVMAVKTFSDRDALLKSCTPGSGVLSAEAVLKDRVVPSGAELLRLRCTGRDSVRFLNLLGVTRPRIIEDGVFVCGANHQLTDGSVVQFAEPCPVAGALYVARHDDKKFSLFTSQSKEPGSLLVLESAESVAQLELRDTACLSGTIPVVSVQFVNDVEKDAGSFLDAAFLPLAGLQAPVDKSLTASGTAFVVLSTTEAVQELLVQHAEQPGLPLVLMGREFPLRLSKCNDDPLQVMWDNFTSVSQFTEKIGTGILLIAASILAWLCLYAPYAVFYIDLLSVPGVSPTLLQDVLLGLLIALGNLIVATGVEMTARWAGFCSKDRQDIAILYGAFGATMVNTVFDLALTAIIANAMFHSSFSTDPVGYDRIVASQMFSLIVPGYLLLPHLLTPIFNHVVPYWLSYLLIRSRPGVTARQAREALQAGSMDLCWRYADILNNTTICVAMLFFISPNGYKTMAFLIVFLGMIYSIDKFLLLRTCSSMHLDSSRLAHTFSKLMSLPLSLLAGCVLFWGYRAGILLSPLLLSGGFMLHFVVYSFLHGVAISWGSQAGSKEYRTQPYPDAYFQSCCTVLPDSHGRPRLASVFNSNPIYALRTRFLGAEATGWRRQTEWLYKFFPDKTQRQSRMAAAVSSGCVPYRLGFEHLLPDAPEALSEQVYDSSDKDRVKELASLMMGKLRATRVKLLGNSG